MNLGSLTSKRLYCTNEAINYLDEVDRLDEDDTELEVEILKGSKSG